MTACGFLDKEPQINADERRYKPVTDLGAAHRKARKERKAQPQFRTRMTRIARIFTDASYPCASASSAQSVFHHVCPSLKSPASGASVSAFIMPKPCGFSTPRTRMPAGIRQGLRPLRTRVHVCQCAGIRVHAIDWRDSRRGHALQRRDSGRLHLRFFKNVIFQTGLTGLTGYAFNPVHPVILSNLICQLPASRKSAKRRT